MPRAEQLACRFGFVLSAQLMHGSIAVWLWKPVWFFRNSSNRAGAR